MQKNPLIIAYYLPQFHPFKENDEWWGAGFTEWTNVKKAKPLYKGHNQPRVPADLGYYDLRNPEVREKQAEMAKRAGVGGFCYWHYWFNGHQLMNRIIDEVAATGKPDFPFCLGWANETWKQKAWNKDSVTDKILIKQTYGGLSDCRAHYEYVRDLFRNKNYIRIDGRPFFLIYKPELLESNLYISLWNTWIKEDGIADSIYFACNLENPTNYRDMLEKGYDAITPGPNPRALKKFNSMRWSRHIIEAKKRKWLKLPILLDMNDVNETIFDSEFDLQDFVIPVLYPQWDHSPRSAGYVFIVKNSTPELFQKQAERILSAIRTKNNKIVILKSWNEWAEGNYMEPDETFGMRFIDALGAAVRNTSE